MQQGLNWDDLRVFLALARGSTLGAAARAAEQDATTVSRRIRRLETALGQVLFEQGATGQSLTDAGLRLLEHAETMEGGARAAQRHTGSGAAHGGIVRVSVSEGFGTWFAAPRLAGFVQAYPGIAVDLIASTGFLNPSRREADVAVMLARPRGGPLIAAKLTDYRLGLFVARDRAERAGAPRDVADLAGERLVGYVPDLIYAPELRYLVDLDDRLEAQMRSSSIVAQANMILGGAGYGILPLFIGDALPGLRRVLADAVSIRRSFWLVVHRDMRRVARVDAFIGWLRGEVAAAQPLLLGPR